MTDNFRRMLGWLGISAVLWIAGGLASGEARLALWILAVACEYISPMFGFRLPGMGRSYTSDWTIEGGHLAERCQLFVIVALGETLLIGGPALYLLGNGIYKTVVYARFPLSHVVGLVLLAALAPVSYVTDNLMVGGLTTLIMILVAVWESVSRRRTAHAVL